MRFNTRGQTLTGLGRRWLTDDRWIQQAGSDAEGWRLVDQHGVSIDPRGASHLAAGGGKWAATLFGSPVECRSNFGYASRVGYVEDVAHDGTAIEIPDQQTKDRIGPVGGPYVSGVVVSARAFPGGFVACFHPGRVYSSTQGPVPTPAGVQVFDVVQVGDVIVYNTHRWLIAQRVDALVGMIVAEAPTFYHDAIQLGDVLRIGWTLTQGDTEPRHREVRRAEFGDLSAVRDVDAPPPPRPQPQPHPTPEPTPVTYARRSPDLTARVADVARRFPQEWEAARKTPEGHRDDRFIRRAAWELHQLDPNVGLNGKRGSDTISTDALAYRNETAPGGAEVIDVITGSHEPAWQDVTIPPVPQPGSKPEHPDGVLGKFIQPTDPGGSSDAPAPDQPPSTPGRPTTTVTIDLTATLTPLRDELAALRTLVEAQAAEIRALKDAFDRLGQATGGVTLPTRIALKTDFGDYLTAEAGGEVRHRETTPASWQTFRFEVVE